ncbi:Serine/Threonine kinase domain protein (macronuclear) [Tetrahymena thermophila SB210]|uniref:Serine/Threonine kinase domain protein n=1 Tax=Tetrahymena thermophila (strain SB210) TaxID=312017 RepID=Q22BC6_TETTS|nr:Serine/Threonine kinase domain protein [Tetrahymena thermophila SB210]EAR82582.1 Serine/Threonine kinase domain protein [Tetrahymena thermophila SB210]|eukprot:XP_001030245.1 Serine/Threonine kinase domain protein [Tetrahymena thermophila SB210]
MADNRLLENKYQLIQRLDEGAIGQVFKAQNIQTKEYVAVKQVNIKLFSKSEHLYTLFEQEIENLKKTKSVNTIKYIDHFNDDNNKYIVVEYVDGFTLKKKLEQLQLEGKTFSENTTISYFIQLLKGIKDLHKNNIIHRDLKLENIMISKEGIIKIIDFGSSRELKEGFSANTLVGTPYNMAPEVWFQQDYGSECDIYSLGVILYQMLFGEYPFFTKNITQLWGIIKEGNIDFNKGKIKISQDMQNLIRRMLKYEQDQRISWQEIYNNIIFQNYLQNTMQTNQVEGIKLKKQKEEALDIYTSIQKKPKKEEIPGPSEFSLDDMMYNQYYTKKQDYEIIIYTLQKIAILPENVRNRCLIFILSKLAYTRASQLYQDLQNLFIQFDKSEQLKEKVSKNLEEIKKIYELTINELQSDEISKMRSNSLFWDNIQSEINQFDKQSDQFKQNFENTLKNHKKLIKDHLTSLEQNGESKEKEYYKTYIISFLLSFRIFELIDSKELYKIKEEFEQLEYQQLLSQFKASLQKLVN